MALDPLSPPPREITEFTAQWRDWLFFLYENTRVSSDFYFDVSAGRIVGHTAVNKFGRNTEIDSGDAADIWDFGTSTGGNVIWDAPTSAVTHNVASTSTDDDGAPVGVGARTIQLYGLTDWDTAEVSEVITMNGTTNVVTANAYVIIHRIKVLTKGATNTNVGTITATAIAGGGLVTAQINPGQGQTQMAIYGIPSTQVAYMTHYYASANRAVATGVADISLLVNPEPNAELTNFLVKHTQGLQTTGTSYIHHEFQPYFRIAGPAIIKIQAASGTNDMDISAGFDLILVTN